MRNCLLFVIHGIGIAIFFNAPMLNMFSVSSSSFLLMNIDDLSPLSMERVLVALLFAALLFAARANNSSADNPFP